MIRSKLFYNSYIGFSFVAKNEFAMINAGAKCVVFIVQIRKKNALQDNETVLE
jgi:hypothetical protein